MTNSIDKLDIPEAEITKLIQRTYRVWMNMRQRCNNPNHQAYKNYGAKGIKVCERWDIPDKQGFFNFLSDLGYPNPGLSLDRIDNDGNYEPGNCRWATRVQQRNNTRQSGKGKGRGGIYYSSRDKRWAVRGPAPDYPHLGSYRQRQLAEMAYDKYVELHPIEEKG